MKSRWSDDDSKRAIDTWAPKWGETLAVRTYSARLLGADPSLVLHGGGNTSAKGVQRTIVGDDVEVLYIKGSGWDLATIEPPGHPAVRLDALRRLRALKQLSDEAMVNEQRVAMLDASAPNPSIECLLHAFLPHAFIDHTHADAILALADQPEAERICRELFGRGLVFVPYVMPGFALAQACAAAFEANREHAEVIVLQQHGVFTFGPDARTSYERMLDVVSRAEARIGPRLRVTEVPPVRADLRRRVSPILRGVLARAGGPDVLAWDERDLARAFATDSRAWPSTQIGTATPDHVIRTKPWPMIAPRIDERATDADLRRGLEAAVDAYGKKYRAYVEAGVAERGARIPLDAAPRVVVVPGVGIAAAGATVKDAAIAREIYEHTIDVIRDATAVGSFRPVGPIDLFDLEYWPLEQAKLGKGSKPRLHGTIALITGAASGIGRATAELFLAQGAHVMLCDRDADALSTVRTRLAAKSGGRVSAAQCDVADRTSVAEAFDACVDAFGGVDVVVSNAGTAPQGLLHDTDGERALEASMEVNFWGHQHVSRRAVELLLAQGKGGALLFNASKAAFNPGPEFGPYAVAKTATVALMRQYAIDLGKHGIRSNAINADRIRTGLFGGGVLEARAKARGLDPDAYFRANLLSREVTGEDCAEAFLYLATAKSTTGCIVTVDGGNAAAFPR
ncbi:MAG: bifunctional aldolase/short-chain dehydrogenase [Deltaproteobacteria bacterium]|nr:bifunctional aldolase/short-chain dehydrogenase [Deltaproteobacteria bacterium]